MIPTKMEVALRQDLFWVTSLWINTQEHMGLYSLVNPLTNCPCRTPQKLCFHQQRLQHSIPFAMFSSNEIVFLTCGVIANGQLPLTASTILLLDSATMSTTTMQYVPTPTANMPLPKALYPVHQGCSHLSSLPSLPFSLRFRTLQKNGMANHEHPISFQAGCLYWKVRMSKLAGQCLCTGP